MKNFINVSNHPSIKWPAEQTTAAMELGAGIVDVNFPNVPAVATTEEVVNMAEALVAEVMSNSPAAVMLQGEATLQSAAVRLLQEKGVAVYAACSERCVTVNEDGSKTVLFNFVQFRKYAEL